MKKLQVAVALLTCGISLLAQNAAGDHVLGRLIVQTRKGADAGSVDLAFTANGAARHHSVRQIDVHVLTVPEGARGRIQQALARTGLFTFVEADGIAKSGMTPNDPNFASQWHLSTIQAASAWDISKGNVGAPIAMIDSGVDPTHPDLAPKLVPGWSFLLGTSNTADVLGHGTATAGTAAAATDNSTGVAGVAWLNPIMPLVVLNSNDWATYSDIASAITYAADQGVRVINISIGGTTPSSTLQSAVNYAWSKGALIFASAMNNGNSSPMYPAACDNVLAISSTNSSDALSSFSDYGPWIDFSAPGESILTTNNGGGYGYWSGTSFSSPISAAVAALVLSVRPSMSNSAVVSLLQSNSDDLGAAGFDQYYGWGRINAYKAVNAALSSAGSSDTTPPSVSISSPSNNALVSGSIQIQGTATDNVGVTKIEWYLGSQLISSTSSSPFSFPWDTTSALNGSYTLTVKAYDAANNVGSASVGVTVSNTIVPDLQPPTVTITSPANGALVSGNVRINVSASDNTAVAHVAIQIDGVQVDDGTVPPYTYTWNTKRASKGKHVITATAWDPAGNMGSATPVTVTK